MTTTQTPITRTATIDGHEFETTLLKSGIKARCLTCDVNLTPRVVSRTVASTLVAQHHTGQVQPVVTLDKTDDGYRVLVGGVLRGTVVKTQHETSIYAAIGNRPGPVKWLVRDTNGADVAPMQDTRARAVSILIECTDAPKVTNPHIDTWYSNQFVSATLHYKGYVLGVSRYPNEDEWIVDFKARPGCLMPEFSNGAGSRCTRALYIKDLDMVALLDRETAELRAQLKTT
jgi:hypothetical protein